MTDAVIRFAQAADVAVLPGIEQAAAKAFLPYLSWLSIEPELLEGLVPLKFLREAQVEDRLWVATVEELTESIVEQPIAKERVVGFVVTKFLVESCFVVELDVHPDYWRRGVGSALMKACCDGAKMQGFEQMRLTTFQKIPWNIPFYQKLGFSIFPFERLSQEMQAIVQHEARYGFAKDKRVAMGRSLSQ